MKQTLSTAQQQENRRVFLDSVDQKSFDFYLATWGRTGLIIPAPGTWGTLGGMVFGIPLLLLTNPVVVFFVACVLFFVGVQSVERIEEKTNLHDPSFIVIDEVVAILFILSFLNTTAIIPLIIAFALFRYFDAQKPWLVGLADRKIKGALGVMVDDIVAAAFTLVAYYIIIFMVWMMMGVAGLAMIGYGVFGNSPQ